MPSRDTEGALQIGEWIVNPALDSISKGTEAQKLEPRTMRLRLPNPPAKSSESIATVPRKEFGGSSMQNVPKRARAAANHPVRG